MRRVPLSGERASAPPSAPPRARVIALHVGPLVALALALGAAPVPVGCGRASQAPAGDRLQVAAAASLRELFERTLPGFRPAGGALDVRVSYAASSTLARQIGEGAPYDVFVSADAENVDRLGVLVDAGTRRRVLGNRLALVGRHDLPDPPADPAALAGRPLSVALAGPAVPAGRYARDWLARHGLLAALEPRVTVADSVRAALALVESGTADCGFVYLTDARAARNARLLWTAPSADDGRIAYVAAVLSGSTSPWADAFLDWLSSETFLSAAAEAGFLAPPGES
jgi:molybdate transport system substrate-binding protein